MKKKRIGAPVPIRALSKLWKIMRLSVFFLLLFVAQTFATVTYSQQTRLTLKMQGAKVIDVLSKIEDESEFFFLFNQKLVNVERQVNVDVKNESVEKILSNLFENTNVSYLVKDRQIVLTTANPELIVIDQQKSVSGKVKDPSGSPLPGVSVVVKGTITGVITDSDGRYTLTKIPENATLQFSFVGMKTQDVVVGDKTTINVSLFEEAVGIDEVVAVGYGTQKKANLTGSVASVSFTELKGKPATNIASVLTGRLPGVTISNFNPQPGKDDPEIIIRGIGTFGMGSTPLIIIDGVEGSLNQVAITDIENVSVLKDAASCAIYGVRAANGVILVTTKRGSSAKPKINITQNYSLQEVLPKTKLLGSPEWATTWNEIGKEMGRATPYFTADEIKKMRDGSDPDHFANTNWFDEVYRIAPMSRTNISLSGGTDNVKYMISGEYLNQEGVMLNTSSDRISLRSNLDVKVNKRLTIGFDLAAYKKKMNETLLDNVGAEPLNYILRNNCAPTTPIRYTNGKWGVVDGAYQRNKMMSQNAVWAASVGENYTDSYHYDARFFANLEIIKDLYFKTSFSANRNTNLKSKFSPTSESYDGDGALLGKNTHNSLDNSSWEDTRLINENLLTYNMKISNHTIGILAGHSAQYLKYSNFWATARDFPNNEIHQLNAGVNDKNVGGAASEESLQSFFGRVNYNFKDKYLFEANVRRDGTSKFASKNRYGAFPSFSAGWIISNENFLKPVEAISMLKLRASWGQLGNQSIEPYRYVQNLATGTDYTFGDKIAAGVAIRSLANDNIRWETTTITDFGLDFTLFDNHIQGVVDYFKKISSDVLYEVPLSSTFGEVQYPLQNLSEIENKGFEASLNYRNKIGEFNYSIGGNIAFIENEILKLRPGLTQILGSYTGRAVGHTIDEYYTYQALGYFKDAADAASQLQWGLPCRPGDIKYKDISGVGTDGKPDGKPDGKIGPEDRTWLGDGPFPKTTYGFNIIADYKGFDLSAFFQGIANVRRLNHTNINYSIPLQSNFTEPILDHWTVENQNFEATYPRFGNPSNNTQVSDFWIQKASYLRLKSLEFGYTLPSDLTKKAGISLCRIYFSGLNLITFTNVKDYDPEKYSWDERNKSYPQTKVYSLGLNVSF